MCKSAATRPRMETPVYGSSVAPPWTMSPWKVRPLRGRAPSPGHHPSDRRGPMDTRRDRRFATRGRRHANRDKWPSSYASSRTYASIRRSVPTLPPFSRADAELRPKTEPPPCHCSATAEPPPPAGPQANLYPQHLSTPPLKLPHPSVGRHCPRLAGIPSRRGRTSADSPPTLFRPVSTPRNPKNRAYVSIHASPSTSPAKSGSPPPPVSSPPP